MKFDSYMRSGFFYELMTTRDKKLFDEAFSCKEIKIPPANEEEAKKFKAGTAQPRTRIIINSAARRWVESVIELFAAEVHLPKGLVIQMLKTGDAHAAERHYSRRWAFGGKSRRLADDYKNPEHEFFKRMMNPNDGESELAEANDGETPFKRKVPVIDQGPINFMRNRWSFCLSLAD